MSIADTVWGRLARFNPPRGEKKEEQHRLPLLRAVGGLLLRCAVDRNELDYIPVQGAVRKGKRPPKLEPRRYGR